MCDRRLRDKENGMFLGLCVCVGERAQGVTVPPCILSVIIITRLLKIARIIIDNGTLVILLRLWDLHKMAPVINTQRH